MSSAHRSRSAPRVPFVHVDSLAGRFPSQQSVATPKTTKCGREPLQRHTDDLQEQAGTDRGTPDAAPQWARLPGIARLSRPPGVQRRVRHAAAGPAFARHSEPRRLAREHLALLARVAGRPLPVLAALPVPAVDGLLSTRHEGPTLGSTA